MARLHDLAVVVGTYTDRNGAEKKRWKTVGSIVETKNGGKIILLDRTFNPAGVPVEPGKDQIMLSMFEPSDGNAHGNADTARTPTSAHPNAPGNSFDGFDDDVPF